MPVGAVVARDGAVQASGRSRNNEEAAVPYQLTRTRIAHAEMNAVAQLPAGDYSEHTIWVSLEPCLVCRCAIRQTHIGAVNFASVDPLWKGLEGLPGVTPHVAKRWPRFSGPLNGPLSVWGTLLPLIWSLQRSPTGTVVQAHESEHPELVTFARKRLEEDNVDRWKESTLGAQLERMWADLASLAGD